MRHLNCCVLIPARTLEDFPAELQDADARSTLAAWTVAWHPELIAASGQLPTWHRADVPPEIEVSPQQDNHQQDNHQQDNHQQDNQAAQPERPPARQLILVPTSAIDWIPDGYQQRVQAAGADWIIAADRQSYLERLAGLGYIRTDLADPLPSIDAQAGGQRSIDARDFFAAGFAALQVEVMTRRLRYASNLDQIYLQTRMVDAARALLDQRSADSVAAMHDVFDCLAEERDHYFSTDPYLIDLTLVVPSTLDQAAADPAISQVDADPVGDDGDTDAGSCATPGESNAPLPTPTNVLIDADTIDHLAATPTRSPSVHALMESLRQDKIGWVAGGVTSTVAFDLLDYSSAANEIIQAKDKATACIGASPRVYGGFACNLPPDLVDVVAGLGYAGIVPINFASGTGHDREDRVQLPIAASKVPSGGQYSDDKHDEASRASIDALTAKPIDAANDGGFLAIGPRLGGAIDSGQIATALLVHWPGQVCDSFDDLRRVASWSLVLGRFWKIDQYFLLGESAYHTGRVGPVGATLSVTDDPDCDPDAAGQNDAITRWADQFRGKLVQRQTRTGEAIARFVGHTGARRPSTDESPSVCIANAMGLNPVDLASNQQPTAQLPPTASGGPTSGGPTSGGPTSGGHTDQPTGTCQLLVNVNSIPRRLTADTTFAPAAGQHIYCSGRISNPSSSSGGRSTLFRSHVDVPAMGYALVRPNSPRRHSIADPHAGSHLKSLLRQSRQWMRNRLLGRRRGIADGLRLQNEFMEVTISDQFAGIAGVYSGASRGNRFSMRLVAQSQPSSADSSIRCDSVRVIKSSPLTGQIEASGQLLLGDEVLATFVNRFSLDSGSRMIHVKIDITPRPSMKLSGSPWTNYIAARVAVPEEASTCRAMIRDKLHRTSGRRIVAPLGLVVDQADRQTLITSDGYPMHRIIDQQCYDTLLLTPHQAGDQFRLRYGFDVVTPVATASSEMVPQTTVSVHAGDDLPPTGWFANVSPRDVIMTNMTATTARNNSLQLEIELVATVAKSRVAKLQFFRDPVWAGPSPMPRQQSGAAAQVEIAGESPLEIAGDIVHVPLAGHQVRRVTVCFDQNSLSQATEAVP